MAADVFDAVRTVLAVREYQDLEVPRDLVLRILEAGRLSASSMNLQPWHFVLIRRRDRLQELGEMLPTGPYVAEAAFAVVVAYEVESRFGVSDASRAIQSMILTAWSHGVGSNWAGFNGPAAVREWCGLPETHRVLAVIPFGYPSRALGRGIKKRKPLGEVVSDEMFGTPLTGQ